MNPPIGILDGFAVLNSSQYAENPTKNAMDWSMYSIPKRTASVSLQTSILQDGLG
jgi:hypothetical protein